jgi:hypothetical protein
VSDEFSQLAHRIDLEVEELDRAAARARRAWSMLDGNPHEPAFADSVALNLHALYSGLERVFEQIARHVDGAVPETETWHRDLLQQMVHSERGFRPAVIDHDSLIALDRWRRFRHLIRNVYSTGLDPAKMVPIMDTLEADWTAVRRALLAFAGFLREAASPG